MKNPFRCIYKKNILRSQFSPPRTEASMSLNIRDPRAAELARELATRRESTMTAVIIEALENETRREREAVPLAKRLAALAAKAKAQAGKNPQPVTKADRDVLWGDA
jgi:antitoxin VapB